MQTSSIYSAAPSDPVYRARQATDDTTGLLNRLLDQLTPRNGATQPSVPQGQTGYPQTGYPQASMNPVQSAAPARTAAPVQSANPPSSASASAFEQQVLDLVNKERQSGGLNALTMDSKLVEVARAKAKDMHDNNYFDHQSPTYGSPFDMMKSFGVSYQSAGENIAKGQTSPEQVMSQWMNSPGHKANIMNGSYTKIGVGYMPTGEWVQEFTG
ncbi:SCP-like extracellular [Cohnella sp. AR92]|nr:SCP-like extracellular [Cohnella sp. AR92]